MATIVMETKYPDEFYIQMDKNKEEYLKYLDHINDIISFLSGFGKKETKGRIEEAE